ncbi:small basic family protein [Bacillus sonorensis]|nr:small basic family protein [Bacillus sonorensis]
MWLPVLGLLLGIAIGFTTNFTIPEEYSNYLSLAILASLDTLIGGIRAHLESIYDELVFVTGFFFNILLAISLAFLGVHLGVDLYLVGMFAFGVRLFQNIAVIRRILLAKWTASRRKNKKIRFKRGYT